MPKASKSPKLDGIKKLSKMPKLKKSPKLAVARNLNIPKASSKVGDVKKNLLKTLKARASPKQTGIRLKTKTSPKLTAFREMLKKAKPIASPRLRGVRECIRSSNTINPWLTATGTAPKQAAKRKHDDAPAMESKSKHPRMAVLIPAKKMPKNAATPKPVTRMAATPKRVTFKEATTKPAKPKTTTPEVAKPSGSKIGLGNKVLMPKKFKKMSKIPVTLKQITSMPARATKEHGVTVASPKVLPVKRLPVKKMQKDGEFMTSKPASSTKEVFVKSPVINQIQKKTKSWKPVSPKVETLKAKTSMLTSGLGKQAASRSPVKQSPITKPTRGNKTVQNVSKLVTSPKKKVMLKKTITRGRSGKVVIISSPVIPITPKAITPKLAAKETRRKKAVVAAPPVKPQTTKDWKSELAVKVNGGIKAASSPVKPGKPRAMRAKLAVAKASPVQASQVSQRKKAVLEAAFPSSVTAPDPKFASRKSRAEPAISKTTKASLKGAGTNFSGIGDVFKMPVPKTLRRSCKSTPASLVSPDCDTPLTPEGPDVVIMSPISPASTKGTTNPVIAGVKRMLRGSTVTLPSANIVDGLTKQVKMSKASEHSKLVDVRKPLKTPKVRKSHKRAGVWNLTKTPKAKLSRKLAGIQNMKTPKMKASPKVRGVKNLMIPKAQVFPKLTGMLDVMITTKPPVSPKLGDVLELVRSPKTFKSPLMARRTFPNEANPKAVISEPVALKAVTPKPATPKAVMPEAVSSRAKRSGSTRSQDTKDFMLKKIKKTSGTPAMLKQTALKPVRVTRAHGVKVVSSKGSFVQKTPVKKIQKRKAKSKTTEPTFPVKEVDMKSSVKRTQTVPSHKSTSPKIDIARMNASRLTRSHGKKVVLQPHVKPKPTRQSTHQKKVVRNVASVVKSTKMKVKPKKTTTRCTSSPVKLVTLKAVAPKFAMKAISGNNAVVAAFPDKTMTLKGVTLKSFGKVTRGKKAVVAASPVKPATLKAVTPKPPMKGSRGKKETALTLVNHTTPKATRAKKDGSKASSAKATSKKAPQNKKRLVKSAVPSPVTTRSRKPTAHRTPTTRTTPRTAKPSKAAASKAAPTSPKAIPRAKRGMKRVIKEVPVSVPASPAAPSPADTNNARITRSMSANAMLTTQKVSTLRGVIMQGSESPPSKEKAPPVTPDSLMGQTTVTALQHQLSNCSLTDVPPTHKTTSYIADHTITVDMRRDNQFPFLIDHATVCHVGCSRVMFIMRGLPGSGKSTVVRLLQEQYPESTCCSADDHFLQPDGEYRFDKDGLRDAHEACQQKAWEACAQGCATVIIDNTNVRMWEMKNYCHFAAEHNYTVITVEPRTTWCWDPMELAHRNKHGVGEDIISWKLSQWDLAIPLYYGWFLNEAYTEVVMTAAEKYFQLCVESCNEYRDMVSQIMQESDSTDSVTLSSVYGREWSKLDTLHCTAFFANRGRTSTAEAYHADPHVAAALGSCSEIEVIGFVFTPRTAGARLRLNDDCLTLWGKDDYEGHGGGSDQYSAHNPHNRLTDNSSNAYYNDMPQEVLLEVQQEVPQEVLPTRFRPVIGVGSRAHLTLGYVEGYRPVQTGFDMLTVADHEEKAASHEGTVDGSVLPIDTVIIDGAAVRAYENQDWVVYLDEPFTVTSLFSGQY